MATDMTHRLAQASPRFPTAAGILLGLGLGGFFDGIVFHQLLQWHHMLTSAGYPPDSVDNLNVNAMWDGLFHTLSYIFIVAGLAGLWRAARRGPIPWTGRQLLGAILLGWGLFNTIEGVVNHHLLGLHHVNESVPPSQWLMWDLAFLIWGLIMVSGGWALCRERPHHEWRQGVDGR